jgi:hypothetical protein
MPEGIGTIRVQLLAAWNLLYRDCNPYFVLSCLRNDVPVFAREGTVLRTARPTMAVALGGIFVAGDTRKR